MNEFVGKICPYCKTAFVEGDDIVVCSNCDMPHHKDCWIENNGCTTFGCSGTIKNADGTATSVTGTQMNYDDNTNAGFVFCTSCGARNSSSNSFCERCGNRLTVPVAAPTPAPGGPVYTQSNPNNTNPYAYVNQQPAAPAPTQQSYQAPNTAYNPQQGYQTPNTAYNPQQGYQAPNTAYNPQQGYQTPNIAYNPQQGYQTPNAGYGQQGYQSNYQAGISPEMQLLIGSNSEYYVPRFQAIKTQKKIVGWNWAGFLFGSLWLFYRKMYAYGAAALGTGFLISLINSPFLSFLFGGASVAIGLFGDLLYYKDLEKKADTARNMTEPYKTESLKKNGGTGTLVPVLVGVGYAIIYGIVAF